MPVNKDALIRYRVINRRLKNKFKALPKLDDLIEECEEALGKPISRRTIQADIESMRYDSDLGFNAPIYYNAKEGGYCYSDENYSIDNIPLNEDDFQTLEFATRILDQFKNVEILKPFSGIIEKMAASYQLSRQVQLNDQGDIIEFETSPVNVGMEFINPILLAIKEQKTIILKYKSFRSENVKTYVLNPYLLKEYKSRWYLIAWNTEKEAINTFGLDRIREIENTDKYFMVQDHFNSSDYFRDSFGITAPEKFQVKNVRLKFTRLQADYILSQPLHHSQKTIESDEDHLIIEMNVMISYELISQILGYGSSVEVLEPSELRELILSEIENLKKIYSR